MVVAGGHVGSVWRKLLVNRMRIWQTETDCRIENIDGSGL